MPNTIYHYTYLLEFPNGMLYQGVRSSNVEPELDDYYGSSKYIPKDIIPNKTILTLHETREDAVLEEVRYHSEHDVKLNNLYYNKANQKSDGFDTYGINLSDEHKQKISESSKGHKKSSIEGYINFFKKNPNIQSERQQKRWDNMTELEVEEFRDKMSEINKDVDKRKDASEKIKQKWQDKEFREKMSKRKRGNNSSTMKEKWKDPEFRKMMLEKRKK